MASLTELGLTVDVNTQVTGEQTQPDVANLSDGSFVVIWLDAQASGTRSIMMQT